MRKGFTLVLKTTKNKCFENHFLSGEILLETLGKL